MKSHWNELKHLIFCTSLIVTSSSFTASVYAQTDASLIQQQADCTKNTAMQWSTSMNRCVGIQQAIDARHEVQDCNKITDLTQRENCHKAIAEKQTGLSADTNALDQTGGTNKSLLMNGVNTAYAALNFINAFGSAKKSSPCMSKKIFGVTAVAGTLSDVYLKNRAKNKVKDLEGKYKLDAKTTAANSQVQAFEYLKDEQNTVADIAGMEKKRNMLLMLGYGAATAMALYEMTPMGANAACTKPEVNCKENPKQDGCMHKCDDGKEIPTDQTCPVKKEEEKQCSNGAGVDDGTETACKLAECDEGWKKDSTGTGCVRKETCPNGKPNANDGSCEAEPEKTKKCEDGSVIPDSSECPVKPPVTTKCPDGSAVKEGETCPVKEKSCPDGSTVPEGQNCPVKITTCTDGSTVPDGQTCPQKLTTCEDGSTIPEGQTCKVAPPPPPEKKTATIVATTKVVNGKETAYYNVTDPNDPSKKYYIVDSKVYDKTTNQLAGNLNYKTGDVSFTNGKGNPFTVTDVHLNSGNSSFVPSGRFDTIHNKIKGGGGFK